MYMIAVRNPGQKATVLELFIAEYRHFTTNKLTTRVLNQKLWIDISDNLSHILRVSRTNITRRMRIISVFMRIDKTKKHNPSWKTLLQTVLYDWILKCFWFLVMC